MRRMSIALAITITLPLNLLGAGGYGTFHGARAMAMGGAFAAVADDPTALWYNPAALSTLPPSVYVGAFYLAMDPVIQVLNPIVAVAYRGFGIMAGIYPYVPRLSNIRVGYGKEVKRLKMGSLWLGDMYVGGGIGISYMVPSVFGGVYVRRYTGYGLYVGVHELGMSKDSGFVHDYRVGAAIVPLYNDIHDLKISGEMWMKPGKSRYSRYFYPIWSVGASYTFYRTVGVHIGILVDSAGWRVGPTFGGSLKYGDFTLTVENEGYVYWFVKYASPGEPAYALRFSLLYTREVKGR